MSNLQSDEDFNAELAKALDALSAWSAFIARSKAIAGLRAKEGRTLSTPNRERLAGLSSAMRELLAQAEKLLAEIDPGKASTEERL